MPIKYVPYVPEPIEGQAVLQNFNRVLKYKGSDDVSMILQRGMPLYEMEKQETIGKNENGNMVIRGECVSACAYLKDKGIQVDLVYIDPPFASGANYAKKIYVRQNPKVADVICKAEKELDISDLKTFEEEMYGDVWSKEKYLNWMYENLIAVKSIMAENASIYVHLDHHIGHYVKILMDEIFGEEHLINEIIWCYTSGGKGTNSFGKKHDNIFYYSKGDEYYLNLDSVRIPYSEKTLANYKKGLQGSYGTEDTINRLGKIPEDYWNIAPASKSTIESSIGYATQKPEALLERIIKASSNENMVVADFFGGSGVTATVANKLSRKFIHCDIGINSIQTTRDRLKANKAEFDVLEIKDGVQLYRNPVQTMDKIKSIIPGLKNEDSLDSFWEGSISDSKLGTVPVYVPNLMDSSSKLLDKATMNRIIHQAIPDLDSSVKKVIVYYIDITSLEEINTFINEDDSTTVKIELRDLKELLDDVVIEDNVKFTCKETKDELFEGFEVKINSFISDRVQSKISEFNDKAFANSSDKKPYKPIEISNEGLELIEFLSLDCTSAEGIWHSDSEIKIDKLGFVIRNGEKTKDFWDCTIKSDKKPLRLKIRNICGDETIWNI